VPLRRVPPMKFAALFLALSGLLLSAACGSGQGAPCKTDQDCALWSKCGDCDDGSFGCCQFYMAPEYLDAGDASE
jgi:hypothetical protein